MADNPYPNHGGGGGAPEEDGRAHGVENGYFSGEGDFQEREGGREGEDTADEDEQLGDDGEQQQQQQRDYYAILNVPRDVCTTHTHSQNKANGA